jgi:diguanylate cyclase (GGDEF)-like protein
MDPVSQQATPHSNVREKFPKWGVTLRVRLIMLLLLTMFPAMFLLLDTTYEEKYHLESDAKQSVVTLAYYALKQHESLIEETGRLLGLLEPIMAANLSDSQECSLLLEKLLFGNFRYANFGIIQPNGDVTCSAIPLQGKINVADRDYFKAALSGKQLSIGDYQTGRIVNKPVQIVAQPFLDEQQQVVGIAYAALDLGWLRQFTSIALLPPDAAITLIDRKGIILYRYPDPQGNWVGVNFVDDLAIEAEFLMGEQDEWLIEADGVDDVSRIYAIHSLGPAGEHLGYIVVGIPNEPLYTPIHENFRFRFTVIAITFFAIALFAWFWSESLILKRTRILTLATRQLSDGDLTARASVRGHDEIARLASEFNQMAEALQSEHHQIQRLNRIHAVLSGINSAILRIRDRDTLLKEACRIAVELGGLRLAWIGLVDAATGDIHKAAWHGEGEDYINDICQGQGAGATNTPYPCVLAVRSDHPVTYNDLENEAGTDLWRNSALAHGFGSMVALPLRHEGVAMGVFALYAVEPGFFEQQESELFLEVASDTSLGLEYIDKDQKMAHLLFHDILTGLPNRRLLEEHLQQEILRAAHSDRYVGVVVINIAGFRRIAGIYGNYIADKVLTYIANHLLEHVRDGDTVAKLEGDEFAIILNDAASVDDLAAVAQSLIAELPSVLKCSEQDIHISIHSGVAIYPNDGEDHMSLLNSATFASAGKKNVGNHSINFFSPDIQQHAQEREQLEWALRYAIEVGDELELYYQPVVDIHSHRIVSVEALSRWHSPNYGEVSPARFIPIAEESGLILPLGEWALKTACQQLEAWQRLEHEKIRVAVNVSFVQLRDDNFISKFVDLIATHIPNHAHQLSVEITESELMDNIDATIAKIKTVKGMGVACYLDDFGTGYSSLSHLHNLPMDVLKIDQSFIRNLGRHENSTSIVRMVIALAQSLNLKTIAEGVETPEQLSLLQELGCNYIQGYLFSKPRPASEITLMLQRGEPLVTQPVVRA